MKKEDYLSDQLELAYVKLRRHSKDQQCSVAKAGHEAEFQEILEEVQLLESWKKESYEAVNMGSTTQKPKQNQIRTELGILNAQVHSDHDYPGIDIRLEREGKEILLAWVEVDQCQKEPMLKLRLYADCHKDEPTDDRAISLSELDEYFAALDNGATELV